MKGYSFTLTIPPNKLVYYSGKRRRFGKLTLKQQWGFLCNLMIKCIWISHFKFIDYVFEKHTDERLHIHGYAIPHSMFKDYGVVERMVDNFYTLNQIVGIKPSVYQRLSKIERTFKCEDYWYDYMNKNQDNIIFKSHYTNALEEQKALDNGVVIETQPKEEFDNNTYRFDGIPHKFLIEI